MITFDDRTLKRYITEVKLLGEKDFLDVARESLNETAKDAKKRTITKYANSSFTVRNKTFFKAFSRVEFSKRGQATTLAGLHSSVGMSNVGSKKALSSDYNPLANMVQQEHGGDIEREITPLNKSRISKSYNRAVSRGSFFKDKTLITQSKMNGKNAKQRFMIALKTAQRTGHKFFLADEWKGIYSISKNKINRLYGYDKGNSNRVKATHFMEKASFESAELIPAFFIKEAIKKIKFRASKIK